VPGNKSLFGAALNQGAGFGGLLYANVLLGMNLNGVQGETCTMTTTATAQGATAFVVQGPASFLTPLNVNFPYVSWSVVLTTGAARPCTQNPLNGTAANGSGVDSLYTGTTDQEEFEYRFGN